MSEQPVGLCLVGCGRISRAHLAAVQALAGTVRLVATVDRTLPAAQAAAAPFGAQAFDDLATALALPEVEAVLIASPNGLHAQQGLAAIAAGKHALIEKPLAESGAVARQMAQAADAAGVVLAVGHTFRQGPAFHYLTDHWADFGTLRAVEVSSCVRWEGPQAPWWATKPREEGLILSLFAPHSLDFVQLCMGADDPIRVHVEAARWQSGWQGEDEAMIIMAYPGRRLASIHISYNQPSIIDRKVLHFSNGVVEIEDGEFLRFNRELLVQPEPGVVRDGRVMGGRSLGHYFTNQLAEFAAAVRGRPHRCVTGHDAARTIDLMDRLIASARANSAADLIDPAPPVDPNAAAAPVVDPNAFGPGPVEEKA
ncbi:Gfo/Idh/MocA family oxidoreductase [Novosphingobium sp. FSY-8]|uniref:Gfo/Idh/MocA family oxidoreductase n=1 Tax=Novosphingobium ovatum TaxID=1908523 RepID=A0ABW9XBR1_9SPHN|nr:Gfo/Idh/MocA family oxidoreductase [Novosphingobium ovatum]NBC35978.1 Gfo/Idh/MocA family oxidoreductase [Novosphingobium ovatum]